MNRQITISLSFKRGAVACLALWVAAHGVLLAAVITGRSSLGQFGLGLCIAAAMISTKYLLDRQAELLRHSFDRGRAVGRRDHELDGDVDDDPDNVRPIRSVSDY